MKFLYNLSVFLAGCVIRLIALTNSKLRKFVEGRKNVFSYLEKNINKNEKYVWVHTASLGEFEQGLPIIQEIRKKYKVIVTFFSPSGYEIRKNTPDADLVVYLPLDTKKNAKKFIKIVQPEMAFFVKYEFWINYLNELKINNIPTYLVSGIFRENQVFFKWHGKIMRDCLHCFTHFFVQNEKSQKLLQTLGFQNVTISGDTRFDRVSQILKRDNSLGFMADFKQDSLCVVFGSSWESDEEIYLKYINQAPKNVKFVIAPHNIHTEKNIALREKITQPTIFFSEKEEKNIADYQVFIIDAIGILTKIYSYADIAYVGGGMGTAGLHNVLEPAVFGIPVLIGKNYEKFEEAKELVKKGGIISVSTSQQFSEKMDFLVKNPQQRTKIGSINANFIEKSNGATEKIIKNTIF